MANKSWLVALAVLTLVTAGSYVGFRALQLAAANRRRERDHAYAQCS